MSPLIFIVAITVLFTAVLLGILFVVPANDKKSRKREKKSLNPQEEREWEDVVDRLEKHIVALRHQIAEHEKKEKHFEKDLSVEKAKNKQLQEKLAQEKGWREKENTVVEKSHQESDQIKKDLLKAQREFEEEHSLRLRLERQWTELKWEMDSLNNEKRALAAKVINLETNLEYYKKESAELKKVNAKLTKETSEVSWVAKTEFDKLEILYKEKEKELERLKREMKSV